MPSDFLWLLCVCVHARAIHSCDKFHLIIIIGSEMFQCVDGEVDEGEQTDVGPTLLTLLLLSRQSLSAEQPVQCSP